MEKLNPLQFTEQAIRNLRNLEKSKGIHAVYSGFNAAFREYFPSLDPIQVVNKLHEEGKVVKGFARGGPMLYLPGEAPERKADNTEVLARITGKQA